MAVALVRGAVDAPTAAAWLATIDTHPAWASRCADADFNLHSSSLRLRALAELDLTTIAARLVQGAGGDLCQRLLGPALACDIDQCWGRRQYAPSRYPPGHAPHAWHQDGALRFDFLGVDTPPAGSLLAMMTCWIALTPCGDDAPGLELIACGPDALLTPNALTDAAVRARGEETWQPVLEPGDALFFSGDVLHRTHASPRMRHDRTSAELRYLVATALPRRLSGDRFTVLS